MGNLAKETPIQWILDNYKKVPLATIVDRLQTFLDIDLAEEEYDLESELVRYLGRDLTPQEIFRLRPILMDIYENYYGEE